jgi:rhomboid family GlyGly-CTERM serine protease
MLLSIKRITPQMGLLLVLFVACVVLQWSGLAQSLRYDRIAIHGGQWYRLLSANLLHLNAIHLWLNMAGLLLVAIFFSRYLSVLRWSVLLVLVAAGVTLGLYWFKPQLIYYVGLSGVLHGLFAAGSLAEIRRFPLSGWLLLLVLVAKLVWEQLYGAVPGSASLIHGRVEVDSHLYGFISGVLVMAIFYDWPKRVYRALFR